MLLERASYRKWDGPVSIMKPQFKKIPIIDFRSSSRLTNSGLIVDNSLKELRPSLCGTDLDSLLVENSSYS